MNKDVASEGKPCLLLCVEPVIPGRPVDDKRQKVKFGETTPNGCTLGAERAIDGASVVKGLNRHCLLYTSDAADDASSV